MRDRLGRLMMVVTGVALAARAALLGAARLRRLRRPRLT
jgi:hypothetical protein